jgi:hypothetical protein
MTGIADAVPDDSARPPSMARPAKVENSFMDITS